MSLARELAGWLCELGVRPVMLSSEPTVTAVVLAAVPEVELVSEAELGEAVELLVVLGGDGTLLYGAGLVADQGVPVLGVNLGRLGFLTTCGAPEARATLKAALAGELRVDERTRIQVRLRSRDKDEVVTRAVINDAVISQSAMARLIELDTWLAGARITTYRADGLIVSTPTGSTAYNLSAGGPIVYPTVSAMVLTPICPHTLTNRPLVVGVDELLTVEVVGEAASVMLTLDGQWARPFRKGDRVEMTRAPRPLKLLATPGVSTFEVLRGKLGWGGGERMA
ncbi:MAG: NAD(+)/NADH kinase [Deltaproteobacteria bacterium]|nr:NAD(+)/NADH kinase [Deltaproteobacteria bacterium]